MLPKVGSFKFHIESYVCDFTGKATLPVRGNARVVLRNLTA